MKKNFRFSLISGGILGMIFLIVAAMTMIISCTKAPHVDPTPPPPPPPPVPTLNLSASTDTVWYAGASTINWSTTNSDSVQVNGVKVSGTSLITPALTTPTTYTVTAFGPGGSVTKQVSVYVWSERMTLLGHYGSVKMNYSVSFNIVDSLNPLAYTILPLDCNTYLYLTNNKWLLTTGPCDPNPGSVFNSSWSWQNNETAILYYGDPVLWSIDSLSTTGFRRWQDKPDPFTPNLIWRTVQKFIHP